MHRDETKDKGDKEKAKGFNCAQMGHAMNEMMKECCTGGYPDCSFIMEGMAEAMKKQRNTPDKKATESKRRKK